MCWNETISLNTFLFSSFVLGLIIYNNEMTMYKMKEMNKWVYIFLGLIIIVQLIEFFIWKNIKNKNYNGFFTTILFTVFFLQPISTNMLIQDKTIQTNILTLYLIIFIPLAIYFLTTSKIYSSVSILGQLKYNLPLSTQQKIILFLLWICFFLFPLFYEKYTSGFLFGLLTLTMMFIQYYNTETVPSMWCWISNTIMIYYSIVLLVYLPYTINYEPSTK
jgi:hypothetical protein